MSVFGTQRSGLYRGVSSHQGWPFYDGLHCNTQTIIIIMELEFPYTRKLTSCGWNHFLTDVSSTRWEESHLSNMHPRGVRSERKPQYV